MNPNDKPLIDKLTEIEILALTIAGEAESEPVEGQIGVGKTIFNRSKVWGKPIIAICLQPNAFSCWLSVSSERDYKRIIAYARDLLVNNIPYQLAQIMWVTQGIINGNLQDNTNGSLFYITEDFYTKNIKSYAKHLPMIKLGHQLFYRS